MTDFSRADVTLANWRTVSYSRWSFQNVSEIIPSAAVAGTRHGEPLPPHPLGSIAGLEWPAIDGSLLSVGSFLTVSETDELVVM